MLIGHVMFEAGTDETEYPIETDNFTDPTEVDLALSEWAHSLHRMYDNRAFFEEDCGSPVLFRPVGSTEWTRRFMIQMTMVPEFDCIEED